MRLGYSTQTGHDGISTTRGNFGPHPLRFSGSLLKAERQPGASLTETARRGAAAAAGRARRCCPVTYAGNAARGRNLPKRASSCISTLKMLDRDSDAGQPQSQAGSPSLTFQATVLLKTRIPGNERADELAARGNFEAQLEMHCRPPAV